MCGRSAVPSAAPLPGQVTIAAFGNFDNSESLQGGLRPSSGLLNSTKTAHHRFVDAWKLPAAGPGAGSVGFCHRGGQGCMPCKPCALQGPVQAACQLQL